VPQNIKNKMMNISKIIFKEYALKISEKLDSLKIIYTVINCVMYLTKDGKLNLSSINPIKAIGNRYRNKLEL
jgi:hypothetical protein